MPYNPDRIVQHAIMNVLKPILINLFIENSYACVEKRGPHKASKKCAEFTRKYAYCLKCDIRKFYPSINQKILSGMFHRIIKDDRFLAIIDDVIFSFEGDTNCPIGNYCSQWFGNYYLTAMDNYILHELRPSGYIRYCDDYILFDNDKINLRIWRDNIHSFIVDKLKLDFSKADIFPTKQGVDFCGYRHFKKYILLRKATAKRIKKRMYGIWKAKIKSNRIKDRFVGQIASANGQLKHCCSYNFRQAIRYNEIQYKIMHSANK